MYGIILPCWSLYRVGKIDFVRGTCFPMQVRTSSAYREKFIEPRNRLRKRSRTIYDFPENCTAVGKTYYILYTYAAYLHNSNTVLLIYCVFIVDQTLYTLYNNLPTALYVLYIVFARLTS